MANSTSTSINSQLRHTASYLLKTEYLVALRHKTRYAAYISSYFCANRAGSHCSMLLPRALDCGCPTKTFLQSASQIRMKAS